MADSVDQVEESKEVFSDLERVVPVLEAERIWEVLLRRTVEAVLAEVAMIPLLPTMAETPEPMVSTRMLTIVAINTVAITAALAEELGMIHFLLKVSLTSCIDDALM